MADKKVDIEQIKDKLKLFGRKSTEKLKELSDDIKNKLEERAEKAEEDDGSIESQAPAGQKQPKNVVDGFLDKLPTLSINIGKGSKKESPKSKPCPKPAPSSGKEEKTDDSKKEK